MKRWYSPRGARRGLLLAAFTAASWGCWALYYSTTTAPSAQGRAVTLPLLPQKSAAPCCQMQSPA